MSEKPQPWYGFDADLEIKRRDKRIAELTEALNKTHIDLEYAKRLCVHLCASTRDNGASAMLKAVMDRRPIPDHPLLRVAGKNEMTCPCGDVVAFRPSGQCDNCDAVEQM